MLTLFFSLRYGDGGRFAAPMVKRAIGGHPCLALFGAQLFPGVPGPAPGHEGACGSGEPRERGPGEPFPPREACSSSSAHGRRASFLPRPEGGFSSGSNHVHMDVQLSVVRLKKGSPGVPSSRERKQGRSQGVPCPARWRPVRVASAMLHGGSPCEGSATRITDEQKEAGRLLQAAFR